MGFIGKFISGILGFGGQSAPNPVQIPQPTVTAQQLVPQTKSDTPEAPALGTNNKRKNISRKSLKIDRSDSGSNPLNI